MAGAREVANAPWLTAMVEYEGQPLALRVRPDADAPGNRVRFPRVATVTHELSSVTSNGLPEASYNDSLAGFDHDVHACVERGGRGLVVLVETFAGKRRYFAYVADGTQLDARIAKLIARYPQHVVSVRGGDDPEWGLYNVYRQRFPW
jgi:hypothetical protein